MGSVPSLHLREIIYKLGAMNVENMLYFIFEQKQSPLTNSKWRGQL